MTYRRPGVTDGLSRAQQLRALWLAVVLFVFGLVLTALVITAVPA